jgi:hypothetical protein
MKTRTILTTLLPWIGFLSLLLWNGYSMLEQHLAEGNLPAWLKPDASDLHLKYSTPHWNAYSYKPAGAFSDVQDNLAVVLKGGTVVWLGAFEDRFSLLIKDQNGKVTLLIGTSLKGVFPGNLILIPKTGPNRGKTMYDPYMEGVFNPTRGSTTSTSPATGPAAGAKETTSPQ